MGSIAEFYKLERLSAQVEALEASVTELQAQFEMLMEMLKPKEAADLPVVKEGEDVGKGQPMRRRV